VKREKEGATVRKRGDLNIRRSIANELGRKATERERGGREAESLLIGKKRKEYSQYSTKKGKGREGGFSVHHSWKRQSREKSLEKTSKPHWEGKKKRQNDVCLEGDEKEKGERADYETDGKCRLVNHHLEKGRETLIK